MPPHLHKSRERESLLASMERNYNIHCIMTKPDSYASFSSSVQAKHDQEDNGRDDQKEIMISKKKKQKKGSGDHNINGIRRKEVKLSTDPQSVAARERRHRISERFKIRQGLDPGGTKMDTVSMLEEAIQYVKFLKSQIWLHQAMLSFNQYLLGHHVPCHDDHNVFASSDHHSLSSPDNDHHLNIYG